MFLVPISHFCPPLRTPSKMAAIFRKATAAILEMPDVKLNIMRVTSQVAASRPSHSFMGRVKRSKLQFVLCLYRASRRIQRVSSL